MSAAKHTPGPWTAAGKHILQDDGGVIAYVTAYAKPTPRQLADARLIAAAPRMLDALEAVRLAPMYAVLDEATKGAIDGAIAAATGATA